MKTFKQLIEATEDDAFDALNNVAELYNRPIFCYRESTEAGYFDYSVGCRVLYSQDLLQEIDEEKSNECLGALLAGEVWNESQVWDEVNYLYHFCLDKNKLILHAQTRYDRLKNKIIEGLTQL